MAKRSVRQEADGIYDLQMREAAIRLSSDGTPLGEIATQLGQTPQTIRRYLEKTMQRALAAQARTETSLDPDDRYTTAPPPPPRTRPAPRGRGPGPHVAGSPKAPTEILDPFDTREMRTRCLSLRKQAKTYEQIAQATQLPQADVRRYILSALRDLEDSELTRADVERRLMTEQVDDLIRGIYSQAQGLTSAGDPLPTGPDLGAIDRVTKLLDRKSKLLGLDQTPTVDIMIRLQKIASESGYDIEDVEEIARDVFARNRLPVPPSRRGDFPIPPTPGEPMVPPDPDPDPPDQDDDDDPAGL